MGKFLKNLFNAFIGVTNSKSLWEIGPTVKPINGTLKKVVELYKATNYDIDADLKLKKRAGKTLLLAGIFTDLWTDGVSIFAIKDGSLISLSSGLLTTTTLKASVASPICYTKAGLDVVWCNGTYLEYVSSGGSHSFDAPTDANKTAIPAGNLVEWFFGKLLIAKGRNLYQTDPLVRRSACIDFTLPGNNRQMASSIRLLRAVDDGFWLSDSTALYFAKGQDLNEAVLIQIVSYPAKFNAAIKIDGTLLAEPLAGTCHVAATDRGLVLIGNSGYLRSLTEKEYNMLSGDNVAMLFKQTSTLNQIIAVVKE